MDATISDPLVGQVLDDRYEVQSRIARGGMATVYLALDRRLDRDIALKVLHHHLADDAEFTVRFVREARSAARLSHPNVVQVYDQGEDAGRLYLAMEYLPGRTLREVLTERGVLTPRETLMVAESVLGALGAAHRAGIVHRDVKPENVVLTDEGRIKVADFGLARAATASTATGGMLLGTVAYLSPELVGRGVADARSDVYAVGVMLFEMLTGRQPFTGDVPIQVAYRHVHEDVPAPSGLVPDLPAELDDLVLAATARDPDQRPVDASALLVLVRAAHAALTEGELDARPGQAPSPGVARLQADPTEVVARDAARRLTQALPGSSRSAHHPASTLLPAGRLDDEPIDARTLRPPGTAAAQVVPRDEDAEFALLAQRRRRRGLVGLLVVLLLALGVAGYAWFFAAGPGSKTGMPQVVGLTRTEAETLLHSRGLADVVQTRFDDQAPKGQVVESDPPGGNRIAKGGTATLVVSKGPDLVTVPPLAGRSSDDAKAALESAGLTLAAVNPQAYDPDVQAGDVIASDPAQGRSVKRSSPVALTISKGPEPVDLPNLTGQAEEDAVRTLTSLKLRPAVTQDFSDNVTIGMVISQTPGPGRRLPGDTVALVVSKGPQLVDLPSVVGQQYDQAKQALEARGLKVERRKILGGFFGTVRSQLPGPGPVPAGSTVTLIVV